MDTQENSSSVSPKRPSPLRRVLKWTVLLLVLVVLLLFFGVPGYLSSASGKKMILANINESVDGKVEIGDISVGWFKGVKLKNLTFVDNAGTTSVSVKEISTKPHYGAFLRGAMSFGKTTIDQPEIVVNIKQPVKTTSVATKKRDASKKSKSQSGFLLEKIDLDLQRGNFTINLESGGKLVQGLHFKNIAAKVNLAPSGKKSSFDVEMGVEGGGRSSKISAKGDLKPAKKKSWTLKGTSGNFTINIDDLDLESLAPLLALMEKEVRPTGKLNADIEATINDGRFEKLKAKATLSNMEQIPEPVRIDVSISSKRDEIRIDKFSLESSFCQLSCTGGKNRIDYTASADLAGLQKFASQYMEFDELVLSGSGSEKGTIYFNGKSIRASGSGSLKNFVIEKKQQRTPVTSAQFSFDMELDRDRDLLDIASLKTSTDFGSISLANSMLPIGQADKDRLDIDITIDLDLSKVRSFASLFIDIPQDMSIAGRLVSTVSVKRKKSAYKIATDNTKVNNFRLAKTGQKPFEEKQIQLFVDMLCDPEEKTIAIDDLRVISSQINITKGRFRKGRTKLTGEIEVEYDLAAVSSAASPFIPQGLVMEGKRKDKIKFESRYRVGEENGPMANLSTKTSFGFDSAKYMGLEFGKAQMDLEINNGVLSFDLPPTSVNEGTLAFAGNIDLSQKPMMLKMKKPMQIIDKIKINEEMTNKLLKYVNPLFANAFNVNGIANFYCREMAIPLGGSAKEKLKIDGQISMDQVRMQGSGLMSQILSVAGGGFDEEMTVLPTDFVLENGYLNYQNMQINMGDHPLTFRGSVGLNKSLNMSVALPFNIEGKTLRLGQEAQRVELVLEGTVDNPSINLQSLFQKAVEKEVDKLLRRGLEDFLKKK